MIYNGELLEWIRMMSELLLVDQMGLETTWSEEGNWAFSLKTHEYPLKIDGWKIPFSFNGICSFLGDMSIFMGEGE